MSETAMFPLGTVLFPHMPLALRVFEERYLVMLARVLDSSDREFGVVLIERGHEVGGGDQRFAVATMARVATLTPGDDEVRLLAHGGRRVEILGWLEDDPHPRAMVRELGELEWSDELDAVADRVERTVRRVLARAAEYSALAWDPQIELSSEPVARAWQLAGIAPLGPLDQVTLLRSTTAAELLTRMEELTLAAEPGLVSAGDDDEFDAEIRQLLDAPGDADPDAPDAPDAPGAPDDDPAGGSGR